MTCQTCRYHDKARLSTCPLFGKVAETYNAGCSVRVDKTAPLGPQTSQHALKRPEPVMLDAKPAKLERDLQRLCEQELSRRGIWFLHLSPKAREKIGTPDLLFAINGKALAIELKIDGGKVTEDQTRNHAEMRANGWTVEVCWSFEQFRAVIDTTTKAAKDQLTPCTDSA